MTADIPKLTPADAEAVARYLQEPEPHRPGLVNEFEILVVGGRGEIYAATEGDEIAGYLSCVPYFDTIWDVDFIHVRADRRRRGLGWQLAASYARDKLNRGQIPLYSNPRGEASERTALRVGFECCREQWAARATRQ